MAKKPIEPPVQCCACGRVRGKACKPWKVCSKCNSTLCLTCGRTEKCGKCWREEYEENQRIEAITPVECSGCHGKFLRAEMENPYVPKLCKKCGEIVRDARLAEARDAKKRNARPGLVEVSHGIHKPEQDGGSGYAYYDRGLNLEIGDIVLLPPTWLDREINGKYDPQEGTVVCTYSDYNGEAQSVIRLVRKANEKPT